MLHRFHRGESNGVAVAEEYLWPLERGRNFTYYRYLGTASSPAEFKRVLSFGNETIKYVIGIGRDAMVNNAIRLSRLSCRGFVSVNTC